MRRRFFVAQFENQRAVMQGDAAHHLGRVLRAQQGQLYELSDGTAAWLARIDDVSRDRIEFALVEPLPSYAPQIEITLLLSVVKFDAFEWALEKATELGVSRIVPLAAARSEKALLVASTKRAERWRKILLESSQQCRRLKLPILEQVAKAEAAFAAQQSAVRILLSESPDARPLKRILDGVDATQATLAIGPEGGWTGGEFAAARTAGFAEASLGNLILRTETAVIASLAAITYALSP
ncbi:MAG TPA: RsmE family RNA methyltransferase [Candidatus Saccharimonadales bacterium]|nr:RsmE family RNA methyltransferase [Candidatus Saccharimonadales bacterium]